MIKFWLMSLGCAFMVIANVFTLAVTQERVYGYLALAWLVLFACSTHAFHHTSK